jgi:hypothetical protein
MIRRASRSNLAALIGRRKPRMWIRTDAELTVVTISGEIDASDINDLSLPARELVRDCGELVINLSCSTDFITVDGLRALLALWSADPTTALPRVHVMRIHFERMTVVVRRGG